MAGHLQQVFQELLATISRRIVQPAVARAVHGIGVGPAVQQELHHSNAVGTNGIAQGGDALGKTLGRDTSRFLVDLTVFFLFTNSGN